MIETNWVNFKDFLMRTPGCIVHWIKKDQQDNMALYVIQTSINSFVVRTEIRIESPSSAEQLEFEVNYK